jgi:hypothetical protein
MTLADAAVWPDRIPENGSSYDQARDCSERNCMVGNPQLVYLGYRR